MHGSSFNSATLAARHRLSPAIIWNDFIKSVINVVDGALNGLEEVVDRYGLALDDDLRNDMIIIISILGGFRNSRLTLGYTPRMVQHRNMTSRIAC